MSTRALLALLPLSLALLGGCRRSTANPRAVEIAASLAASGITVDPDDPSTCMACHTQVVLEWQESMHSRAHHAQDPIYGGMRSFRMTKEGPGMAEKCGQCHNPRDVANAESKVARSGVSCATCHNLSEVHLDKAKQGAQALVRGPDRMMRGSHEIAAETSPVHGTGPALAALADGRTVCLACHAQETNKAGIETCATGLEMEKTGDARTCASCHMPDVASPSGPVSARPTHKSHAFRGPHRAYYQNDPAVLREAVTLAGRFDGDRLVLTLENKSAHGFPTGFPARMAVVVARGLDASGAEVFRNVREDPMKDHPEAVLNKVFHDGEGNPTLAPYGVKLARDSRLGPGEKREIAVALPAGVVKVEATVKLWLIAGLAAKKLGVDTIPEAKPTEVLSASFSR